MEKPKTKDGYDENGTLLCERVLVTLLRGLGPWKDSVCLVGGLTPRYLVPTRPPVVPQHAGTGDVDTVIELKMLSNTKGYHTLEENLKRLGFERAENREGKKVSWRWRTGAQLGNPVILEFLADDPSLDGGRVQQLPTEGEVSALNIPHASMVFDLYQVVEVRAELLGGDGMAVEHIKHANLVSFTCLKVLAYEDRKERKDAHDLVYCIEYAPQGPQRTAEEFRKELNGKHGDVIKKSLNYLRSRFLEEEGIEGYKKDGPVSVAKFELGEGPEPEMREARILRQREVSDLIRRFLALIENHPE